MKSVRSPATIVIVSIDQLQRCARRMPADAVFSGYTAAWLHGLDVSPCNPIEVTLPQRSTTSHLARTRLTRSDFTEAEATGVSGLPATTATRTFADLGRRLPLIDGVGLVDMALHAHLVTLDELRGWTVDHPRHRGVNRLLQALAWANADSESPMESRLRMLLVLDGLPPPLVQASLRDFLPAVAARADLFYPRERLVLEYDGGTHRQSLAADNRRQNRLVEAGYRILRFTAGDILNRPASVVAQVRRALS